MAGAYLWTQGEARTATCEPSGEQFQTARETTAEVRGWLGSCKVIRTSSPGPAQALRGCSTVRESGPGVRADQRSHSLAGTTAAVQPLRTKCTAISTHTTLPAIRRVMCQVAYSSTWVAVGRTVSRVGNPVAPDFLDALAVGGPQHGASNATPLTAGVVRGH